MCIRDRYQLPEHRIHIRHLGEGWRKHFQLDREDRVHYLNHQQSNRSLIQLQHKEQEQGRVQNSRTTSLRRQGLLYHRRRNRGFRRGPTYL